MINNTTEKTNNTMVPRMCSSRFVTVFSPIQGGPPWLRMIVQQWPACHRVLTSLWDLGETRYVYKICNVKWKAVPRGRFGLVSETWIMYCKILNRNTLFCINKWEARFYVIVAIEDVCTAVNVSLPYTGLAWRCTAGRSWRWYLVTVHPCFNTVGYFQPGAVRKVNRHPVGMREHPYTRVSLS